MYQLVDNKLLESNSEADGAPELRHKARSIAEYRNRYMHDRCFIIGNGPSLNRTDLRKLKDETTFGVNSIFYKFDEMGFKPNFYVVEDTLVAEDRAREINSLTGTVKIFGNYLRYCLDDGPNVFWTNTIFDYANYPDFPHFSTDASQCLWVGGTVTYICMQLAFYLGFREVYLVGFDHSYDIPVDSHREGNVITSSCEDTNHFHPEYFGKGYRWHDPQLDRMEKAYRKANSVFSKNSRRILNATDGGDLTVFDRVRFDSLFPRAPLNPSDGFPTTADRAYIRSCAYTKLDNFRHRFADKPEPSVLTVDLGADRPLEENAATALVQRVVRSFDSLEFDEIVLLGSTVFHSPGFLDMLGMIRSSLPSCDITLRYAFSSEPSSDFVRTADAAFLSGLPIRVTLSPLPAISVRGVADTSEEDRFVSTLDFYDQLSILNIETVFRIPISKYLFENLERISSELENRGTKSEIDWSGELLLSDASQRNAFLPYLSALENVDALPHYFECPGVTRCAHVGADGHLYPCRLEIPALRMGNILTDELTKILSSEAALLVREKVASRGCIWCQGLGEHDGIPRWSVMSDIKKRSHQHFINHGYLFDVIFHSNNRESGDSSAGVDECSANSQSRNASTRGHDRAGSVMISAIVCTYNNCTSLSRTIDSLFNQSFPKGQYEIIVVDNGSKDDTLRIVGQYEGVIYLVEENKGLSFARNRGIREAKGDIVAFIDDDAEASRDWLSLLYDMYSRSPKVMAAGGRVEPMWETCRPLWLREEYLGNLSILKYSPGVSRLFWPERIIGTNCSFKKRTFELFGSFDTNLGRIGSTLVGGEDTEVQKRVQEAGYEVLYDDRAIVYHSVPASRLNNTYMQRRSRGHHFTMSILNAGSAEEKEQLREEIRAFSDLEDELYLGIKRGSAKCASNALDEALQLLRELADKHKNSPELENQLGLLHWRLGDIGAALKHFTKSLNLDPLNRNTVINCFHFLRAFKDENQAKKLLKSYLIMNPNDKELQRIM